MFKKFGLLALTLLGISAALPAVASAQDGYYYGRPQGYYYNDRDYDRHARHEWKEREREERRERRWREQHWREHEWREHRRYYDNYWNNRYYPETYYNNYYGYPR